jgi:hypothetical protein
MAAAARPGAAATGPSALKTHFMSAAQRHGVPRDLLVASSQTLTHIQARTSAFGSHGVMQLTDRTGTNTLGKAAELVGRSVSDVRESTQANIDAAAALLRQLADDAGLSASDRERVDAWYAAVVEYVGVPDVVVARGQADAIYATLSRGVSAGANEAGLTVRARTVRPEVRAAAPMVAPMNAEYPAARWVAAHSSNYRVQNRPSDYSIDRVVIHTTQGSYAGAISWFQNAASNVSAHYVIRSSDGDVTQMVRHKDVAWHVGSTNNRSIGIEHEGWVDDASWYTEEMYRSSAAVTRFVCDKYGVPIDRTHIIAHSEAPGATHTDPGPHWDWDRYLGYVRGGPSGWSVIVDNEHAGFSASGNWVTSSASGEYGGSHRHARPVLESDVAWFSADVPAAGRYRIDVWYPQNSANNSRAPYIVAASGGNEPVYVDQRSGGGRWRSIGVFSLPAGKRRVVGVSRWTGTEGWIEADAVRISAA